MKKTDENRYLGIFEHCCKCGESRSYCECKNAQPGDCPRCNSFDDDLSERDGICESCYLEEME